ncbi:MAG: hypothetical protein HY875_04290 [Chloroflexi bacterium]|nr:hypothetical protein [Chloroflexota bacterium]
MTLDAETLAAQRRPLRQWLVPLVVGVLVLAGVIAVVVLAQQAGTSDAPPEPGAFVPPAAIGQTVAFDVQQAQSGKLNLASPSGPQAARFKASVRDLALPDSTPVEVLTSSKLTDVRPGDWVTVFGVFNEVRNFAIRSVVVIRDPGKPLDDGFVRSPAGFLGDEAAKDQAERPILGGLVESVGDKSLVITGATGAVTITLSATPPLYRLVAANMGAIVEGGRAAFLLPAGAGIEATTAVLVLPPQPAQ